MKTFLLGTRTLFKLTWVLAILAALLQGPVLWGQGPVVGQGSGILGLEAWHEAGLKGEGVKVAILDFGFFGYQDLIGSELPPAERLITQEFGIPVEGTAEDIAQDPEGPKHGTAVAEVIFDIAPDATFYLVATESEEADLMAALDWMIEEEVDVVVASISLPDFGCLDPANSAFEPKFQELRERGVLLVTSAGNDRLAHWQGVYEDANDDGLHDFAPDDDAITFDGFEGEIVDLILTWGDPCLPSPNDYDLFLYDEDGELLAESLEDNTTGRAMERIEIELPTDGLYDIVIEKVFGNDVLLDLVWVNGGSLEYAVPQGSISFFEPAISASALTVGSVNWRTLEQEESSSQGPTKDNRTKPDIAAPTCVQTVSYGGGPELFMAEDCGFSGTSAAAPHVGGVAVLVKQANPDFTPDQIQAFLADNAQDLGPPGLDNLFGYGLLSLPAP